MELLISRLAARGILFALFPDAKLRNQIDVLLTGNIADVQRICRQTSDMGIDCLLIDGEIIIKTPEARIDLSSDRFVLESGPKQILTCLHQLIMSSWVKTNVRLNGRNTTLYGGYSEMALEIAYATHGNKLSVLSNTPDAIACDR